MLELTLEKEGAWANIDAEKSLARASMAFLHEAALRMLGLNNEVTHSRPATPALSPPAGASGCPTCRPVSTP